MYPESDPSGQYPVVLYPVPGKVEFTSLGASPIRGMWVAFGKLYAVTGADVCEITPSGAFSVVGVLTTFTGTVSISNNLTELIFVDGVAGYIYNPGTSTFSTIPSTAVGLYDNFPAGATHVVFVDGYFLVNDPDNPGRFYRSESYSGLQWKALSYATAERDPDDLLAIAVNERLVYLVGEEITELWYNEGSDPANPFIPVPGMSLEIGILAPFSIASGGSGLVWLAKDSRGQGTTIITNGTSFKKISNYALDYAINTYGVKDDAIGFTYQQAGHEFYELTFPTEGATWVYDFTENKWHKRKTYGSSRHEVQHSAYFDEKILVGSATNGKLLELNLDTFNDDGQVIEHIRVTQVISNEEEARLYHATVKLDIETGRGTSDYPDPQVSLAWSDNGGKTWSNPIYRNLGALGEYNTEVFFKQLGRSKHRIYKITHTDKTYFALLGGYVEVHSGQKSVRDNPVE